MGVSNFDEIECDSLTVEDIEAGTLSLDTPLTKANANESLKRELIQLEYNGTLSDSSTNPRRRLMTRAGKVKKIWVAAGTRMVGGTNTWAFAKVHAGVSSNLLSTTNVNPINVPAAADTGEALTLTSTDADLEFVAGDLLLSTLVCGSMGTDGANYVATFEVEYNDA